MVEIMFIYGVLYCLYLTNSKFRYFSKFLLYLFMMFLYGIILTPICALRIGHPLGNLQFIAPFMALISKAIHIQWIIRGKEHMGNEATAHVIISNHQSSLDMLGMFELLPFVKNFVPVVKDELIYAFPVSLLGWLCGTEYISRSNKETTKKKLNQLVTDLAVQKKNIWIYPESTRRNTGEIHAFKKGAFHLAISKNLPILPIVFSRHYFLNDHKKTFSDGLIIVTALPIISTNAMDLEKIDDLMEKVKQQMDQTFERVNSEIDKIFRTYK